MITNLHKRYLETIYGGSCRCICIQKIVLQPAYDKHEYIYNQKTNSYSDQINHVEERYEIGLRDLNIMTNAAECAKACNNGGMNFKECVVVN